MMTPKKHPVVWAAGIAALLALPVLALPLLPIREASSFPIYGNQTALPVGSELGEDRLAMPREQFHSEALEGQPSYMIRLGDIAFNSPQLFGGAARRAGMSCNTCHVSGSSNGKFFIPGLSRNPGTLDTTSSLFNAKADNRSLDPVRIPSLRGARFLSPYGHDGRMTSLREFVRNVIINEFAGPEPSPRILDAIVAYIQDIDFLPNHRLGFGGRLHSDDPAEIRGEALFNKPFPHNPALSCAGCHVPSGAFVDHRQHDVGSGGLFKTPTLLDANFNAPYFHDGRFQSYEEVIAHFGKVFDLGLSPQDASDLAAYLRAVGDADRPFLFNRLGVQLQEVSDFASVLGTAIPARDAEVVSLTVGTIDNELRELIDLFPDHRDPTIPGGAAERVRARAALKGMVLQLSRIEAAAAAGDFDAAAAAFQTYRYETTRGVGPALQAALPWSLLNPKLHDAHYDALRQMMQAANKR